MEKIYSEEKNACEPTKVSSETVQFLLNYSKALRIVGHKNFKFETNLN